jgi:hypothetical protein
MSRARHHASKKHHERKHADGGEAERGNPHVIAEAKGHTLGTIHGSGGKKRMDRKGGGSVHSDVAEDKKLVKSAVKSEALKAGGGKVGSDTHPYTGGKSGSAERPYTSAHKCGGKVGK